MKNPIKHLRIQNFKSIKDLGLDCKRINLFIGRPNVGKSNILEALSLFTLPSIDSSTPYLKEIFRYEEVTDLFTDQVTSSPIQVNLKYEHSDWTAKFYRNLKSNEFCLIICQDEMQQWLDERDSSVDNKDISKIAHDKDWDYFFAQFRDIGNLTISPTLQTSHRTIPVTLKFEFKKDVEYISTYPKSLNPPYGENLFAIFQEHEGIRNYATSLFAEYDLRLANVVREKKFVVHKQKGNDIYLFPYSLSADTLQRLIFHVAAIETNTNEVILFEEPEAHSFPPYVNMLAQKIIHAEENQFFITTHSPNVLNTIIEKVAPDDVAVFRCTFENYETKAEKLSSEKLSEMLDNGADIFLHL